jgi:hypothetical protein
MDTQTLPIALRHSWVNTPGILLECVKDIGLIDVDGGFFKILCYNPGVQVYEVHVIGLVELEHAYITTRHSVPEIVAHIRKKGTEVSRNAEQWLRRLEGYHG